METEAVYRERFDNVLRVLKPFVDGGGSHGGKRLDLGCWNYYNRACVMGLCSEDAWFQEKGFTSVAADRQRFPSFKGWQGGEAAYQFLGINHMEYVSLFTYSGYVASITAMNLFTAGKVYDKIAEYMVNRFERGIRSAPEQSRRQDQVVGGVLCITTVSSGDWTMIVPPQPTSPPFSRQEVLQWQQARREAADRVQQHINQMMREMLGELKPIHLSISEEMAV